MPKITTPKTKKNRKRPITWFNPPYSLNVATNVAQEFLKLIDKHFPIGHPVRSVVNRTTVKVSYRALPNMGAQISKHNQKILRQSQGGATKPLHLVIAKRVGRRTALYLELVTRMG